MKPLYVVNTDRRVGLGNMHVTMLVSVSVDIFQIIITGTTDYQHTIHIINYCIHWNG